MENSNTNILTGIEELDNRLGGGVPFNDITIICGRPGAGKSALARSMALTAAENGESVLYVSFSEKENTVKNHVFSTATGVPYGLFARNKQFSAEECIAIYNFTESATAHNFAVKEMNPNCDAIDILVAAENAEATYLVIDYADLWDNENLMTNMKVLFWATQNTDLTIVVLGMLSRGTDEDNIKTHDIRLYEELCRFAGTVLLIKKKENKLVIDAEKEHFSICTIETEMNEETFGVGKWAKEGNK